MLSLGDLFGSPLPLLEHAPDATLIVDNNGQIQLVNAQTERLFGYYREELLGRDVETLIPDRYRRRHVGDRAAYATDPRARPMGADLELYGLRKDGSEFPLEISLSPIVTKAGTFVAAAVRDVTERKAVDDRLRELNAALEQASRAKDQFLASMSHELRTPLNAVIGFTGTLLMRLPGPLNEEQERQLSIVQWSARHLLSLINDVLDLAKIESGKYELLFEHVPVDDVVKDVAASLAAKASEKGLELTTSVTEDAKSAMTDRRSLRQILLNLTGNAIKYTERGSVRIDVRATAWKERGAIALSVIDTGIGIKADDQERLFQAFEQLDPLGSRGFESTGLGLYLCRNLTRLLDAELRVTSEHGRGSTFTLTVPKER